MNNENACDYYEETFFRSGSLTSYTLALDPTGYWTTTVAIGPLSSTLILSTSEDPHCGNIHHFKSVRVENPTKLVASRDITEDDRLKRTVALSWKTSHIKIAPAKVFFRVIFSTASIVDIQAQHNEDDPTSTTTRSKRKPDLAQSLEELLKRQSKRTYIEEENLEDTLMTLTNRVKSMEKSVDVLIQKQSEQSALMGQSLQKLHDSVRLNKTLDHLDDLSTVSGSEPMSRQSEYEPSAAAVFGGEQSSTVDDGVQSQAESEDGGLKIVLGNVLLQAASESGQPRAVLESGHSLTVSGGGYSGMATEIEHSRTISESGEPQSVSEGRELRPVSENGEPRTVPGGEPRTVLDSGHSKTVSGDGLSRTDSEDEHSQAVLRGGHSRVASGVVEPRAGSEGERSSKISKVTQGSFAHLSSRPKKIVCFHFPNDPRDSKEHPVEIDAEILSRIEVFDKLIEENEKKKEYESGDVEDEQDNENDADVGVGVNGNVDGGDVRQGTIRIDLPTVNRAHFLSLLAYIQTGKLNLENGIEDRLKDNVDWEDLIILANEYKIAGLRDLCRDKIVASLTVDNCMEIMFGLGMRFADIKEIVKEFITKNYLDVLNAASGGDPFKDYSDWQDVVQEVKEEVKRLQGWTRGPRKI